MLTNEAADEQVKGMTDGQLAQLAEQVTGRYDDQDVLATRAVLEKVRRTQQAQQQAAIEAPRIAARESARYVYEQSGADPAGFDRWYAERQANEATQRLANQRAAAQKMTRF